jgi:hypothetical protein
MSRKPDEAPRIDLTVEVDRFLEEHVSKAVTDPSTLEAWKATRSENGPQPSPPAAPTPEIAPPAPQSNP